jgi:hypothetical protein
MGGIETADVQAAIRHFPDRAESLVRLARISEPVREMCQELAAVEEAMSALEASTTPEAHERRAECEGWIIRLTSEISDALDEANVLPLLPRKRP